MNHDDGRAAGTGLRIELLRTPDCPHADGTHARVNEVVGRLAPGAEVAVVRVDSAEEAGGLGFPGSPTVRVNGEDLEGPGAPADPGLACRIYEGSGLPPEWMVEAGVLRALAPRHLLFLCVANSARSQMAEGIARSRAPVGVRISSAGSEPTAVRDEAVRVLDEIGIDIRGQRSSGTGEVEGDVEAVITLCAEEVCPVWLSDVPRLHWPLADPAAVGGGEDERLEAFRSARDRLRRRIELLFPGSGSDSP